MATLAGRVVACLEARYASEMGALVQRHGGIPYRAPCMREVHDALSDGAQTAVDLFCQEPVDAAVFLTGVGARTLLDAATASDRRSNVLERLSQVPVAARGPKAANALRSLGVRVDLSAPEPYTSEALLAAIEGTWRLHQKVVYVQCYGAPIPIFRTGLESLGARVIEAHPYGWERPMDVEAVLALIQDLGEAHIDILAATNAGQVDNLFSIASERGLTDSLRSSLARTPPLVAAQGVVCAAAFERHGVAVDIVPERTSMGSLVLAMAAAIGEAATPPRTEPTGTVAVMAEARSGRDMSAAQEIVRTLPTDSVVAILGGRARSFDRLVEHTALERGLRVRVVRPERPLDPAECLVRAADHVVVVGDGPKVGRVLKAARKYAKPVHTVERDATP